MTEVRHTNGSIKHIRRVQQAPYPLIKVTPDVELFGVLDPVERTTASIANNPHSVPNERTQSVSNATSIRQSPITLPPLATPSKSKKLFPNLVKSKQTVATINDHSMSSIPHNTTSSSSSSSSTKLARQIFNNLNIFSNNHKQHQQQQAQQQQAQQQQQQHNQNDPYQLQHTNGNIAQSKHQHQVILAKPEPVSSLRRSIEQNTRRMSSKSTSSTASTQNLLARRCRGSYRSQDEDLYLEADGGSSCYSSTKSSAGRDLNSYGIRRPSIDTISTYLSDERLQYGSTETTYVGDDDVFLPPQKINGSIVGIDPDSDMISRFVSVVNPPAWPNCRPCVMCLEELQQNPENPVVLLIRCDHLMHLNCLNHLIINQSEQQQKQQGSDANAKPLYIECPVCGIVYGEKYGNQPAGTMTWSIIPKQLAGHEGQNSIQIVYKYVLCVKHFRI